MISDDTIKENKVIASDNTDVTFMEGDDDSVGFGNNADIDIDDI